MHMADALITPVVGGTMWAVTAGITAYSAKKVQVELDEAKVPLMGVLGAFIFAAQMINFTIPATGSSGHLGGGLILAILLGPLAGFLTMASILTVQALFFGDGGLLALGCNIFNLGFYTCFLTYPLIYKRMVKDKPTANRIFWGSMIAAVVGLQLGSLSVVLETFVSGIAELPLKTFLILMQPIHLAIGLVEGLVTSAVVTFVWKARPEIIRYSGQAKLTNWVGIKPLLLTFAALTVITGGMLSWFASSQPDGLEWSIFRSLGQEELQTDKLPAVQGRLAKIQEKTAVLPDYGFKETETTESEGESTPVWPEVNTGTSVAGLVGGLLTIVVVGLIGFTLYWVKQRRNK